MGTVAPIWSLYMTHTKAGQETLRNWSRVTKQVHGRGRIQLIPGIIQNFKSCRIWRYATMQTEYTMSSIKMTEGSVLLVSALRLLVFFFLLGFPESVQLQPVFWSTRTGIWVPEVTTTGYSKGRLAQPGSRLNSWKEVLKRHEEGKMHDMHFLNNPIVGVLPCWGIEEKIWSNPCWGFGHWHGLLVNQAVS